MFCNMLASSLDSCGCCIGLQIYFILSNDVAFMFSWWFWRHSVFYNNFHISSVLGSWLHLLVLCCVQALYGNYKTKFLCWLGADLKGGLGGHPPPPPPTLERQKTTLCGSCGRNRNKAKHSGQSTSSKFSLSALLEFLNATWFILNQIHINQVALIINFIFQVHLHHFWVDPNILSSIQSSLVFFNLLAPMWFCFIFPTILSFCSVCVRMIQERQR